MPCFWIMVIVYSPKGGLFPVVHHVSLNLAPRRSPECKKESVKLPGLSGHLQVWALLLHSANHHHRTMGGKSEPCEGSPIGQPLSCMWSLGLASGLLASRFAVVSLEKGRHGCGSSVCLRARVVCLDPPLTQLTSSFLSGWA